MNLSCAFLFLVLVVHFTPIASPGAECKWNKQSPAQKQATVEEVSHDDEW